MPTCDVLVLDDDPLVLVTLVEVLRDEGLTVAQARDATEARSWLGRPDAPGVFVTDPGSGDDAGWNVAWTASAARPELGVVFVTCGAVAAPRPMPGRRACVLVKPFAPAELVGAIRRMLRPASPAPGVPPDAVAW